MTLTQHLNPTKIHIPFTQIKPGMRITMTNNNENEDNTPQTVTYVDHERFQTGPGQNFTKSYSDAVKRKFWWHP
jgi:hypothetical protein